MAFNDAALTRMRYANFCHADDHILPGPSAAPIGATARRHLWGVVLAVGEAVGGLPIVFLAHARILTHRAATRALTFAAAARKLAWRAWTRGDT